MRASRHNYVRFVVAGFALIGFAQGAAAQSPPPAPAGQHQHEPPRPAQAAADHSQMGHGAMPGSREGSGTAWLPDASPMYAIHREHGGWQLMLHGNGFLQYLDEGSARGADQFGSINWIMGMAERPVGAGRLALRGMFSLEPFTIGGCGYPDLLATGELCEGEKIHDLQHQHDLFMELAAVYDRPLAGAVRWQIYGGPAGEPALGPVAYPHRISALPNLLAPSTHHWLDSTHITYGVVTTGVYGRRWKAEASLFNGREPDEDRTGFDLAALDSRSGRLWYLPTDNLALQVSAGHLNEAEPGENGGPRVDVGRMTASATYHRLQGDDGVWASTLAWGRNTESGDATSAVLLETSLTLHDRDAWFGRFEVASKSAHDLDVPVDHHGDEEERAFTVNKLQAGYTRYFDAWGGLRPGVGLTASLSIVPRDLEPFYGDRVNPGVGVYFTIRPAAMRMTSQTAAPAADSHAGHAAPAPPKPAAAHEHAPAPTPAQPAAPPAADPHAGHAAPAPATPVAKPADPHAGHGAAPAPRPAGKRAAPPAPAPAPAKSAPVVFADDPKKLVCSPAVDPDAAPTTTYKGKAYYFCTNAERLRFITNPETYLKEKGGK